MATVPVAPSDPSVGPAADLLTGTGVPLRTRWLGRVEYREAWSLQQALHAGPSPDDHLLLLEHPPTFTLGRHADRSHVLVDPAAVGIDEVAVDRGGDVTYHGPGQLVAYPILHLPGKGGGSLPDVPAYVATLEQAVIDTLRGVGLHDVGRLDGFPGVWVAPRSDRPRKVAAVGVRVERGRSLHGVAVNVAPDLGHFAHIVPCGITEHGVTSLAAEGVEVDLRTVAERFATAFAERWAPNVVEHAGVVWRTAPDGSDLAPFSRGLGPGERTTGANRAAGDAPASGTSVRLLGRLAEAGVAGGVALTDAKPEWMRAPVRHDAGVLGVRRTLRDLDLVTVCEEAGCPNLSECWADGTATFMVCGERCTRACGFCLVDTRRPEDLDPDEPARVAEAVERLALDHAVVTMVARDDLPDGGAAHVAATVRAVRDRRPGTRVEVLVSDLKGSADALRVVLDSRPDVVNHNVETVPRLQRAVRPSAGYARSLALLGRSAAAGVTTKSGLVVGMGETEDEIVATLADLAAVGVSIVTIGQYLRPTSHHLPVARWWTPEDFERFARRGHDLGLAHVESSPFTRSSYHARAAADAAHTATA
ncbi:MAG: lipoyl synthase, partial [Microthrixaceae bacterium]